MSQMTSLDPSPCAESKEKWNDTSVGKSSNGSIAFYVMEKKIRHLATGANMLLS
jgi:hypothetical protein